MESNSKTLKKLLTESYLSQKELWPHEGKHILAQYDDDSIVVYQAYKPSIAKYAVEHQRFGGPDFSLTRMTWIKTNFLWMMFRCGWCDKPQQERVLAIWLKRDFFEKILSMAVKSSRDYQNYASEREYMQALNTRDAKVRLQWDPDHHPSGAKHPRRRAIQLGLKEVEDFINGNGIVEIQDITDFIASQYPCYSSGCYDTLVTPKEQIYKVSEELERKLGINLPELPADQVTNEPGAEPEKRAAEVAPENNSKDEDT
eukprot:TRINITY_DN7946_c0_g1_i1.p1 TRINITY_DN7946_c0_g1~~TRINITY_DN7946_c0_g1_i1.p1  ORF type:complete len:257 (-),score=56.10 TRINITY_DN7946_c0_g1_i1:23-793(-)